MNAGDRTLASRRAGTSGGQRGTARRGGRGHQQPTRRAVRTASLLAAPSRRHFECCLSAQAPFRHSSAGRSTWRKASRQALSPWLDDTKTPTCHRSRTPYNRPDRRRCAALRETDGGGSPETDVVPQRDPTTGSPCDTVRSRLPGFSRARQMHVVPRDSLRAPKFQAGGIGFPRCGARCGAV